jgi:hypothetical protein
MKRAGFAIAAVFLLSLAAAQEEVSLERAIAIAQLNYTGLQKFAGTSSPPYRAVVGDAEVWVAEFSGIWVPVSKTGAILEADNTTATAAFKVHLSIKRMSEQRAGQNYPTKKSQTFDIWLGSADLKKDYLTNYVAQVPAELKDEVNRLAIEAGDLKTALQDTSASIQAVEARESKLLSQHSSQADVDEWRSRFSAMLDAMERVVAQGTEYNSAKAAYYTEANKFLNSSSDESAKNIVRGFNPEIQEITGAALPGLNSTTQSWRTWIDVTVSDATIGSEASQLFVKYREFASGTRIETVRNDAFAKVNSLSGTVPTIQIVLGACKKDLTAKQQADLDELNRTYSNARSAYDAGAAAETRLDFQEAERQYREALSWYDKAEPLRAGLQEVKCPGEKPVAKPVLQIITEFLASPLGIVAIILAIALIAIYAYNKRKGEQVEEYVPRY